MNKHETKYKNTSRKMVLALIALMEKKSFESITIKELCEKADVNRSTFYSHYQNLNELLDEARGYIIHLFLQETAILNITPDCFLNLSDEILVPYLRVISSNRNVFLISDFHLKASQYAAEYNAMIEQIAIPLCNSIGITDRTMITYLTNFYNSGCHSIIMQWLEGGCKESIPYICRIIRFCVLGRKEELQ